MGITVKVFAVLREILGVEEFYMRIHENISCQEVLALLKSTHGERVSILESSLLAINGHYAGPHSRLSPGDELAILPPVSGG